MISGVRFDGFDLRGFLTTMTLLPGLLRVMPIPIVSYTNSTRVFLSGMFLAPLSALRTLPQVL